MKWCPLKSEGSKLCNKSECAWWVDECSVVLIMYSLLTLAKVAEESE